MMTAKQEARFVATLEKHFGKRKDFYHIATGPTRETWFTAEAIAALSRAESRSLTRGCTISGEQSYSSLLRSLKLTATSRKGLRKIPDISGYSLGNTQMSFVVEAKVVDTQIDKQALKILHKLKDQLDCAKQILPSTTVIGLVFGVHRQSKPALTATFNRWLTRQIESVFPVKAVKWFDARKVIPVAGLQSVKPLGGKWSGEASLGLAVFEVV